MRRFVGGFFLFLFLFNSGWSSPVLFGWLFGRGASSFKSGTHSVTSEHLGDSTGLSIILLGINLVKFSYTFIVPCSETRLGGFLRVVNREHVFYPLLLLFTRTLRRDFKFVVGEESRSYFYNDDTPKFPFYYDQKSYTTSCAVEVSDGRGGFG